MPTDCANKIEKIGEISKPDKENLKEINKSDRQEWHKKEANLGRDIAEWGEVIHKIQSVMRAC